MPVNGEFAVVRVRRQGFLSTLKAAFKGGYSIEEAEAVAVPQ
jgi:hypothetical protein